MHACVCAYVCAHTCVCVCMCLYLCFSWSIVDLQCCISNCCQQNVSVIYRDWLGLQNLMGEMGILAVSHSETLHSHLQGCLWSHCPQSTEEHSGSWVDIPRIGDAETVHAHNCTLPQNSCCPFITHISFSKQTEYIKISHSNQKPWGDRNFSRGKEW